MVTRSQQAGKGDLWRRGEGGDTRVPVAGHELEATFIVVPEGEGGREGGKGRGRK